MGLVRDPNDYAWSGVQSFSGPVSLPDNTISDRNVAAAANIADTKVAHRVFARHIQASGADIVTRTEIAHSAHAGETVSEVKVIADAVPAGGDKTVTVDVKKSHAGGAFASILTAPLAISSAIAAKTPIDAPLSGGTATLVEDDLLEISITAAGSTGTQAQGLLVIVTLVENGT